MQELVLEAETSNLMVQLFFVHQVLILALEVEMVLEKDLQPPSVEAEVQASVWELRGLSSP